MDMMEMETELARLCLDILLQGRRAPRSASVEARSAREWEGPAVGGLIRQQRRRRTCSVDVINLDRDEEKMSCNNRTAWGIERLEGSDPKEIWVEGCGSPKPRGG